MKNKKVLLLLRITAAFVTFSSIYIFAPWEYALYYLTPLAQHIEQQADEAVEQGLEGIILYVQQGNKEPELYASGWHNKAQRISAYPQALFKIASIAKLYDASAITKLVANETLSLNHTLADYLPDIAKRIEHSDQITLTMLVQHRSGIPNFTDNPDFNWGESSLDVMALVLDKPADFLPGTDYAYSNSNYLLLQKIMTAALGYSYEKFIQQEILNPLHLNSTYFSVTDIDTDNLMSGYHVGYDDDFKELDQGYVATAADVGVFLRALNTGGLFNAKELSIYTDLYEFEHTGWVLGYTSIARYHPDIDTVVILFTNTTGNETILLRDIVYSRVVAIINNRQL